MNEKHVTSAEVETNVLGAEVAKDIKPGSVVALYGVLGAGKTVFTKGLARGFGISARILSPTFTLMREYPLPGGKGKLYHFDLYRLKSANELKSVNLKELIGEKKSIVVIEWAEKAKKFLPKDAVTVKFKVTKETGREITISEG